LWVLEIDGKEHRIELLISNLSGKKRVRRDGKVVFEQNMFFDKLKHTTSIGEHVIYINEETDRADLKVDEEPFSLLYLRETNKLYFQQDKPSEELKKQVEHKNSNYFDPSQKENYDFNDQVFDEIQTKRPEPPIKEKKQVSHRKLPKQTRKIKIVPAEPTPEIDFFSLDQKLPAEAIIHFTNQQPVPQHNEVLQPVKEVPPKEHSIPVPNFTQPEPGHFMTHVNNTQAFTGISGMQMCSNDPFEMMYMTNARYMMPQNYPYMRNVSFNSNNYF